MPLRGIPMRKLWRGAVFALKNKSNEPTVWYHCDYVSGNKIDCTAIHNFKSYTITITDRNVWLRV